MDYLLDRNAITIYGCSTRPSRFLDANQHHIQDLQATIERLSEELGWAWRPIPSGGGDL